MPDGPASPLLWSKNGDSPDQSSLSAWCAYTGQSEEAAKNWGWLDALHPADREMVRSAWKQAIRAPGLVTLSYRIQRLHAVYQSYKILNVPLFNDTHQLQAWFTFSVKEPTNQPVIDEHWELRLIYGMIFTQVVLGILCLSLDGVIQRVNARLCQLTGYSEKELLSMTIWQLSAPEDVHLHLRAMSERLTSDHSYPPFRIRYQRKEGGYIWVRVTQFLVRQPSNEPYYFFFVIEDVSAQVQAEEERAKLLASLQEAHSEALARTLQLEAVFDTITEGILVCDHEGQVIQTNTAVKRILRLEAHPDLLTLPLPERMALLKFVDENGQTLSAGQWPLVRLLHGEDLRASREEDLRLLLPNGHELYVNHSGSPLRDQDGQVIGAVLVIHDVTERHILENRTRNSFRILLALAEELVDVPGCQTRTPSGEQNSNGQLPAAFSFRAGGEYLAELTCQMLEYQGVTISLLDPQSGRVHLMAIAGFSPEEKTYLYKKFTQAPLTDYLDEEAIALLRDNEVVIREFKLRADSPHFYTALFAPMIIDGRLTGILSVKKKEHYPTYTHEEISLIKAIAKFILLVIERERIQREWIEAHSSELALREANRRFDEFLSIASHELRTPLAGIKGNIQLALRRLNALRSKELPAMDVFFEKLDKMQEFLLQAEHRVNVQNRMISDLLDVSRIQANKLELVMKPCDLVEIGRAAVRDQQYNVPERVIALEVPEKDQLMVLGDADRLGQVIHNYLTNALKYSPPEQPISVRVEKREDFARVSVRDQGPGLTPEEQKNVWERFYRVKDIPAQGTSGPGLGLGLHICRTIIEAHQGQFGLESTPGKGATFWFTLPPIQPTAASPGQPSNATGFRSAPKEQPSSVRDPVAPLQDHCKGHSELGKSE